MISKFIRKDKQFILNLIAMTGVVTTAVSAIIATKKAYNIPKDKEADIKYFIPTGLIIGATMLCIISSDYISESQKASLMTALMASHGHYKNLRESVDKLEDDVKVDILKRAANRNIPKDIILERTEDKIFYEEYSGKFFVATMEEVLKAECDFNRQLTILGMASLNELYEYFGLPETQEGNYLGWAVSDGYFGAEAQSPWVDFMHSKMIDDSGMEYYFVQFVNQPDVNYDLF